MKYKLLILDLDGTTVEKRQNALPSMRVTDAVQKAAQKLAVTIATGREYVTAKPIIEALDLNGLGIVNGGSRIIDMKTGQSVYSKVMSIDAIHQVIRLCSPFGYDIFLNEEMYSNAVSSIDEVVEETEKLFINAVSHADAINMLEELEAIEEINAHLSVSWSHPDLLGIDITHREGTKQHGAERLMKKLGIEKDAVIAIGDGHNDVPLMMAAGYKVAMGDAPDEVKAVADYVTETLANDGVAATIDKLILKN